MKTLTRKIAAVAAGCTLLGGGVSAQAASASPSQLSPEAVQACPEVNDPPTYSITSVGDYFFPFDNPPRSATLYPGDQTTFTTTQTQTIGAEVTAGATAGASADFGPVAAEVSVSYGVSVSGSVSQQSGQTITSTNDTASTYTAVLGSRGKAVAYNKTVIVAPCDPRTTSTTVAFPQEGNLVWQRQ